MAAKACIFHCIHYFSPDNCCNMDYKLSQGKITENPKTCPYFKEKDHHI